jgi:hypothetical protein
MKSSPVAGAANKLVFDISRSTDGAFDLTRISCSFAGQRAIIKGDQLKPKPIRNLPFLVGWGLWNDEKYTNNGLSVGPELLAGCVENAAALANHNFNHASVKSFKPILPESWDKAEWVQLRPRAGGQNSSPLRFFINVDPSNGKKPVRLQTAWRDPGAVEFRFDGSPGDTRSTLHSYLTTFFAGQKKTGMQKQNAHLEQFEAIMRELKELRQELSTPAYGDFAQVFNKRLLDEIKTRLAEQRSVSLDMFCIASSPDYSQTP